MNQAGRHLQKTVTVIGLVWQAMAPGVSGAGERPPAAEAEVLTSAEALKHSVLSRPAFWLIPEREGCVETTTRGPGTPPATAPASWDTNVWVCAFTAEFGVARCRNLNRVDVNTRKGTGFSDRSFVARPDRSPAVAATFGGLTDAFVSQGEQLITNARREYLLISDTFKRNPTPPTPVHPGITVHRVCTGRWEPMTAKELADLEKKGNATPPRASPSR